MKKNTRKGFIILITALTLTALCIMGAATAGETVTLAVLPADDMLPLSSEDTDSLPSSFDLRDYGYVTPLRDQGEFGVCWSFSIMGAIESNILKTGLVSADDAENLDLSELQLVYFSLNRDGVTTGDVLPEFENGRGSYTEISGIKGDLGGDIESMLPQLSSGIGIATEDNDDLKYENMHNIYEGEQLKLSPELAVSENRYYPQNYYIIDMNDRDSVKKLLMEKGAASVSYHNDAWNLTQYSGYTDENGVFVKTHNCTYDHAYSTNGNANHGVTLIGWDDTYPRENFAQYVISNKDGTATEVSIPEHDGAWLIKNSRGDSVTYTEPDGTVKIWDGYLWISYEDKSIQNKLTGKAVFYDIVPSNDYYDSIYQYDTGLTGSTIVVPIEYNTGDIQKISAKNIFTADKTEAITAVAFYTGNTDINYTLSVFVNETPAETVSGKEPYRGYHTITLSNPVLVHEGDSITVLLSLSMIKQNDNEALGIICGTTKNVAIMDANFITETEIPGRSYVRFDDLTEERIAEYRQSAMNIDLEDESVNKELDEILKRYNLTREELEQAGIKIEELLSSILSNTLEYADLADKNGWIDISSIPAMAPTYDAANYPENKIEPVDTKYGPARIKVFTVAVDEVTVTRNTAKPSEDAIVDEIYFTKVVPGTTVYYMDKLTNIEKPDGDLNFLGGFRITADSESKYGGKVIFRFTAESENPENVTLMRPDAFGQWKTVPTTYIGDNTYAAITSTLGAFAVVEDTANLSAVKTQLKSFC